MAWKVKKPCSQPGCPELVNPDRRKCYRHSAIDQRESDHRRGNARSRGYDWKWEAISKAQLREHPNCARCGMPATQCDHIKPAKGDLKLFFDPNNRQSLCHSCHSEKTAREDGGFGNPRREALNDERQRTVRDRLLRRSGAQSTVMSAASCVLGEEVGNRSRVE
jgi:5-methylcytosine-specific restriction enzyme A